MILGRNYPYSKKSKMAVIRPTRTMSPDFDFEFFACISWDLGSVSEPVSEPESVGAGDGGAGFKTGSGADLQEGFFCLFIGDKLG